MKYHIKREIANDPQFYRYFAEDDQGRFMDGTIVTINVDAPQSQQDNAVEIVILRLRGQLNVAETIKTIEL